MTAALSLLLCISGVGAGAQFQENPPPLRGGAAIVDVSPRAFPVKVNGGFLEAAGTRTRDPLSSRALVLDDGTIRLALVVVDSCMMPRELLDRAKDLARDRAGIPVDRILISATHTHTAPAAMGALGCAPDPSYAASLPGWIADSIALAAGRLVPVEVGWGVVDDLDHTHNRRWIRRPDRILNDPFGLDSVRANMHPGYLNPDAIGPSGPVDPGLSLLALRTASGRPLAVLANYSMHYFGTTAVSADYYGKFRENLTKLVGAEEGDGFVAMMSQGTSGDQHWMNYGAAKRDILLETYSEELSKTAFKAFQTIKYQSHVTLAMSEARLRLKRRIPSQERLAWARPILEAMGDRAPKNQPEVYAREAEFLHDEPERELKLQAIRIGDLGIAAIPDEVFALTGLKIKARSPLASSFTIELANGSEGYIPPPEQHFLGGYTTWPARTAALEVQAEPKIVEAVLGLLEKVSGKPRRQEASPEDSLAKSALALKPWAYWRLDEMEGDVARDSSGSGHDGKLEPGYARYLAGVGLDGYGVGRATGRATQLAGGRLVSNAWPQGDASTVAFWFWNGLPHDARGVTGSLIDAGCSVAIDGSSSKPGLLYLVENPFSSTRHYGKTQLGLRRWRHLALARDAENLTIYLDGSKEIEIKLSKSSLEPLTTFAIGGGVDKGSRLEGKVDEVAVFDRALTSSEIASLRDAGR